MAEKTEKTKKSSSEEQIGFHKGALSTLAKEREEMLKIVNVVEQLMQLHIKGLKELGVDLEKIAQEAKKLSQQKPKAKPIEDILK